MTLTRFAPALHVLTLSWLHLLCWVATCVQGPTLEAVWVSVLTALR